MITNSIEKKNHHVMKILPNIIAKWLGKEKNLLF